MAIELHHLHPGHDDEQSRLKARIAELEARIAEPDKTFPNELKANEKLCIKYEKEWMDECRKNENKIVPYTAIPSENVEELESLIRSAEYIFEDLVNVGILSFFLKLKDHYEVSYRAF